MKNTGRPKKPPRATQDASTIDALKSKSNAELLDEIDQMLSSPESEIDVDAVEAHLAALQDRAPVMEGYDPRTGWNQLQEDHPALFETEDEPKPVPRRRTRGKFYFVRFAAVFAAVLLCLLVTANALGYNPVQSFLAWVGDTIQMYSNPSGMMELPPDVPGEYRSLREALDANGAEDASYITWIPRDYALREVSVRDIDGITQFNANYVSERGRLIVRIYMMNGGTWTGIAESAMDGAEYFYNNITYYITTNYETSKVGWKIGPYSYEVSGHITEEELKRIIKTMK